MRIDILTIFPDMFLSPFAESMIKRAIENGILEINTIDIREYSSAKHKNTDDYPFGGGAGMVMSPQPIFDCIDSILEGGGEAYKICMTPRGRVLSPSIAKELSKKDHLMLLCGRYEGIDERVMSMMDDEISIGDYVLTGGELPAMVLIDCLARFIPGVLGSSVSALDESFSLNLLEYPQYTRPSDFRGMTVPDVLLNGNHKEIAKWRAEQSLKKTMAMRPDLLEK
ncbi:MAG: tRNA (guanosine(37)-N1)-methyltransferase TrmD [Clostridia bacterium]